MGNKTKTKTQTIRDWTRGKKHITPADLEFEFDMQPDVADLHFAILVSDRIITKDGTVRK